MFRTSFEIHVRRDKRWVLEGHVGREAEAVALADRLGADDKTVEAVRVVRLKTSLTGREYPSTLIEREIDRPPPPANVARAIDRSAACAAPGDVHTVEARLVASRSLRAWLDRNGLTPMEMLHSGRELRRALEADQLVPGAIFRVAKLEAAAGDGDVATRRKALEGLLRTVGDRAREADARRRLPILEQTTLAELIARFPDFPAVAGDDPAADPMGDAAFWPRVVIARDLTGRRSLAGKLERLLDLGLDALDDGAPPAAVAALVDPFLADCLAAAEPVQDLLGPQPDLAAAVHHLLDLADRASTAPPTPTAERLTRLLAAHRLPDCRAVLLDRVRRSIGGEGALARDPRQADRRLADLTDRLVRPGGVVGGPAMAAALVDRSARALAGGGPAARVRAVQAAAARCLTPWQEVVFLVAVAGHAGTLPADQRTPLLDTAGRLIGETLSRAGRVDDLWRALAPEERRDVRLDRLAAALAAAPLDETAKRLATAQLQRLSQVAA